MPGYELIGEEERAAVNELFDDGGVLFRHGFDDRRNGRFRVVEFERAFAEYLGAGFALAVTSGTAALKVALKAMGVGRGDEVITQAFTFVATVEAIAEVGATPVVVNVDDTLNMAPGELEQAMTDRTRVILPVHMLGVAADMNAINEVGARHGVPVLEDACESLGATWNGKKLGTLGKAGAFSFDFGKTITTGEGGMVVTDDEEVYLLAKEYHDHGHENNPAYPRGRDTHRIHGFNYRMTEIQAAIGVAQLAKLGSIVASTKRHHAALEAGLNGLESEGIGIRRVPTECEPLGEALIFQLPTVELAKAFADRMAEQGLATHNLPNALDWHFAGKWDHIFSDYGVSKEELWERLLPSHELLSRCISVPVMLKYSDEQVRQIAAELRGIAAELL